MNRQSGSKPPNHCCVTLGLGQVAGCLSAGKMRLAIPASTPKLGPSGRSNRLVFLPQYLVRRRGNWSTLRIYAHGVPGVAQWLTNPIRNHEVAGSIPGLAQCLRDPALP